MCIGLMKKLVKLPKYNLNLGCYIMSRQVVSEKMISFTRSIYYSRLFNHNLIDNPVLQVLGERKILSIKICMDMLMPRLMLLAFINLLNGSGMQITKLVFKKETQTKNFISVTFVEKMVSNFCSTT